MLSRETIKDLVVWGPLGVLLGSSVGLFLLPMIFPDFPNYTYSHWYIYISIGISISMLLIVNGNRFYIYAIQYLILLLVIKSIRIYLFIPAEILFLGQTLDQLLFNFSLSLGLEKMSYHNVLRIKPLFTIVIQWIRIYVAYTLIFGNIDLHVIKSTNLYKIFIQRDNEQSDDDQSDDDQSDDDQSDDEN